MISTGDKCFFTENGCERGYGKCHEILVTMFLNKHIFRYDGENFDTLNIPNSRYSHRRATSQLGNYKGQPFIVGCNGNHRDGSCNKAELLNLTQLKWSNAPDFIKG